MDAGLEVHRALIEQFAAETPDLFARLVREDGVFHRADGFQAANKLVGELDREKCEVLATMLQETRKSALFDALRIIHETFYTRSLRLLVGNSEVPLEPYGYTLFQEYITLLELGDWESLGG